MTTPSQTKPAGAEDPSIPDHVQWTEATTESGKTYLVGTDPRQSLQAAVDLTGHGSHGGMKAAHGEREAFNVKVTWPVGDGSEVKTSTTVYDVAGIMKYKLYKNSWPVSMVYTYTLEFENNMSYEYVFEDAEGGDGGRYGVSALLHRWHWVKFNSNNATIVRVYSKGSKAKEIFG